jgi:hypothetical protein
MKSLFLFLALFIASMSVCSAQDAMEVSPYKTTAAQTSVTNFTEDQWDVQFNYDGQAATGFLGNAGAEFTGTNFYTTRWNRNMMVRWNADGTIRDSMALSGYTGTTGIRDLAWDGEFLYGGIAVTNQIAVIDTGTMSVVATITCPGAATVRSIAYDASLDGFWVSNWADALTCVSREGIALATISTTLAAKYGSAYDPFTPGGPFLWVWDQGAGQGNPQLIHQFDLNTLQPTDFTFDILTVITNGGTTAIAGGLFITDKIVAGKATLGGLLQGAPDRLFGLELATTYVGPLNPFNLQAPNAGTIVESFPGSDTPVSFTWDTSSASATYRWVFGTSLPTQLLSVARNKNYWNTTLGELDEILADAGLASGQSWVGSWDVWAYRNNAPDFDTLSSANGPRTLTLKRGVPALGAFHLMVPQNNYTLVTSPFNHSTVENKWSKSGEGAKYMWIFGVPTIATPTAMFWSDNNGFDTTLTMINSNIDRMLSDGGILPGQSLVGEWAVYAFGGNDSLKSVETYSLTLMRQGRGDILIAYDSSVAASLVSRDSVANNLSNMGITFDLQNRGTNANGLPFAMDDYQTVIWLGQGTSVASTAQVASIKDWLNSGTSTNKKRLIIYAEDIGWQFGRTGSTFLDLEFCNTYLGFHYWADRPHGTAAHGLIGMEINSGIADSTIGTWPDVLGAYEGENTTPLYQHRVLVGTDSLNAIGHVTDNFVTATFGDDIRSLRSAEDSPEGSPVERFVRGAIDWVNLVGVIERTDNTPKAFALDQNYPNPFNPTTKISFSLPANEFVSLKIFDVLGREVETLVSGEQTAGSYSVEFDASRFTSGMYFYRLTAGKFSETKKMLLVK